MLRIATLLVTMMVAVAGPARAASYHFTSLEYPPFQYTDDKGKPAGAVYEVVREVMKSLGHEVKIDIMPWTRSLRMVQLGQADAIFTAYRNPEREKFLDYGNEVLAPQIVSFFVKSGAKLAFDGDFCKLKGKMIGVTSSISYGIAFDRSIASCGLSTERVPDLDSNLRKLVAGRIDYVISNRFSAITLIKEMKLEDKITELPHAVDVVVSFIAFSKERKLSALRDKFDETLRRMKKDGSYATIMTKNGVDVAKIEEWARKIQSAGK